MDNKIKDELQKLIVEEMNKIAAEKESELTNRGSHIICLFAFFGLSSNFHKMVHIFKNFQPFGEKN